jgi:tripartite-type tricarboxylate transporter receptor subunit TctC
MGSAGNGSVSHVAGELFMFKAGLRMAHVPYRGGSGRAAGARS